MTYRTEFPEFDAIPEVDALVAEQGWKDTSWHNDVCPSFLSPQGTRLLWVNYADRSRREMGEDTPRFLVVEVYLEQGEVQFPEDHKVLAEGETFEDVKAAVSAPATLRTLTRLKDERAYAFDHRGVSITVPTKSSCGRFVYDPKDESTEYILRDYGFTIWETGGGCSAWGQEFVLEDGRRVYMYVTGNDASHEAAPGETVVGLYLDDDGVNEYTGEAFAMWTDMNESDLCDELEAYCTEQGIPCHSADEMLISREELGLTDAQVERLNDFVKRWDFWQLNTTV